MVRRWELELIDGPMRSCVTLLYRGPGDRAVIWNVIDGPPLAENVTQLMVIDELYSALLQFIEDIGGKG